MLCRPFNFHCFNFHCLACVLLNFLSLMLQAHARPMYTDVSNSTFPLVLCGNLQDALTALKEREVIDHEIGAGWLEINCVSIDPCTQKSSNEDAIFGMPFQTANPKETLTATFLLHVSKSSDAVKTKSCGLRTPHKRDPKKEQNPSQQLYRYCSNKHTHIEPCLRL